MAYKKVEEFEALPDSLYVELADSGYYLGYDKDRYIEARYGSHADKNAVVVDDYDGYVTTSAYPTPEPHGDYRPRLNEFPRGGDLDGRSFGMVGRKSLMTEDEGIEKARAYLAVLKNRKSDPVPSLKGLWGSDQQAPASESTSSARAVYRPATPVVK